MNDWLMQLERKGNKAELLIYDVIGSRGLRAKEVVEQIKALQVDEINVRINSIGGNPFDAVAIMNALERHSAKVTVDIDALAASAASMIAMAADSGELRIASNAFMMIHNSQGEFDGNREELRQFADRLQSVDDMAAQTYAKRAKVSKKRLTEMMDKETWMSATEALNAGLVDAIGNEMKIAASADLSKFSNVPDSVRQIVKEPEMADDKDKSKKEFDEVDLQKNIESAMTTMSANILEKLDEKVAALKQELRGDKKEDKKDDDTEDKIDVNLSVKEAIAKDRERCLELRSLYKNVGLTDETILDRWEAKGLTVVEAKCEVADLATKQNVFAAGDTSDDEPNSEHAIALEYKAHQKIHQQLGVSLEDYTTRRQAELKAAV